MGRFGRASGRLQIMLTDLDEEMLPCRAQKLEKVKLFKWLEPKLIIGQMSPISNHGVFAGDYYWERFPHIYAKAIILSRKLTEAYDSALERYDVLIRPTMVTQADRLHLDTYSALTKMSKTIGKLDDICPLNASGHPALAFPIDL